MPELMEHIDSSGTLGEGFAEAAKAAAGEGFEDSKVFDNIPDVATLVKNYGHTQRDKGKKLEGVIQKPTKDATDEQKTEYRTSLLKELGAPADAGAYELPRPDKLPGGVEFDEEAVKAMDAREAVARQFFFERGWPVSMVKEGIEFMNKIQLEAIEARMAKEQQAFEADCKELDKLWTGDSKIANCRIAFKAAMVYGPDGLKNALKESKINEDVTNYEKWRSINVSPSHLQTWYNVGSTTNVDATITDEGGPAGASETELNPYDHPTSKDLFKEK